MQGLDIVVYVRVCTLTGAYSKLRVNEGKDILRQIDWHLKHAIKRLIIWALQNTKFCFRIHYKNIFLNKAFFI
jgi:hypothetical protein